MIQERSGCCNEQSHQLWLTEHRLLIFWKLPTAAADVQSALRQRAGVFPCPQQAVGIKEALAAAKAMRDFRLCIAVSAEQEKYQRQLLDAHFGHPGIVEVQINGMKTHAMSSLASHIQRACRKPPSKMTCGRHVLRNFL